MARRPRIDLPGYHHIVNRGVNRVNVFSDVDDKEKFLQIVCKACRVYAVVVHDYCLMDNHYHLLIENSQENLSLFMRQINANYAIYYNKKTKRTGHLWQGRYSSWYILGEDYLYRTIKYIAFNPIEAGMAQNIRGYPFTLASMVLRGEDIPLCMQGSMLVKQYDVETLAEYLEEPLSEDEIVDLNKERKKKVLVEDKSAKHEEKKELSRYFDESMDKESRNQAVYEAYMDGHTQMSISKEISLSDAMISIIIKQFKI
jgi:REP element-mobilizing transposase RayT